MKTNSKDSKLTWSVIVKRKTAFDAMPYCVEDLYYPANDTERSKLNWSPFEVLTVLKVSCCVKVNPFSASSLLLRRWKLISIHCESRWNFITYLRYSVLGKGSFSWPIFILHRENVCSGIRRRWWMMFWMWTIHVYAFQESNILCQRLPCVTHKREIARNLRETVSRSPVPMNFNTTRDYGNSMLRSSWFVVLQFH